MNTKGFAHKYGDNVDTDVIIPARYLNTPDHKELAAHCMEDIDKEFVNKLANKVVRTRRNTTLEPMNSYERRIIHSALQDHESVTTYSVGQGINRKVVIALKPRDNK